MSKIFLALCFISLSGCASELQKIQTVIGVVTTAKVTSQQIIIAANTFDGLETLATQWLTFCSGSPKAAGCDITTLGKVVTAVRAGRSARDTLEGYAATGGAGPSALYNTLVGTIATLQKSVPTAKGS